MEKYTEEGLPVILEDVANVLIRDLDKRKEGGLQSIVGVYGFRLADIILNEQPALKAFLKKMENSYLKNSKNFDYFCFGLTLMYELLKKQGETNKPEKELKI